MWKRKRKHWEFYYYGKKVGFITMESISKEEVDFIAKVNGKILGSSRSLFQAKCIVENEF